MKKLFTYPAPLLVRHEIAPGLGLGPVYLHYRDDLLGHMYVSDTLEKTPFYNCKKVSPESIIFPDPPGAIGVRKQKKERKEKTTKNKPRKSALSIDDLLERVQKLIEERNIV